MGKGEIMIKIKDNVALKELKNFGFVYYNYDRIYELETSCAIIRVKKDRKIRFEGDILDIKEGDKIIDCIYSLIKANLVEKVENVKVKK